VKGRAPNKGPHICFAQKAFGPQGCSPKGCSARRGARPTIRLPQKQRQWPDRENAFSVCVLALMAQGLEGPQVPSWCEISPACLLTPILDCPCLVVA